MALNRDQLSRDTLRSAVNQILNSENYATNAQRVSTNLKQLGGSKTGAEQIIRFARSSIDLNRSRAESFPYKALNL